MIAEALKQYGFLVADNGSNWFFQGSSDRRWNDDNLNQLKEIPGSAFEVVRSAADRTSAEAQPSRRAMIPPITPR